jgi:hypothetical protein
VNHKYCYDGEKVQQFHQNNFSALDDGNVGQNMLCKYKE